jgi:hypothetical protein
MQHARCVFACFRLFLFVVFGVFVFTSIFEYLLITYHLCVYGIQIASAQKKKEGKKRQTLRNAAIKGLRKKTSKSPAIY